MQVNEWSWGWCQRNESKETYLLPKSISKTKCVVAFRAHERSGTGPQLLLSLINVDLSSCPLP